MRGRYDLGDDNVTGLCAKCHAFEHQRMIENEAMDIDVQTNSNDDISNCDEEEENKTEQEESDNDDDNDEDGDDDSDEKESDDDSFHELTYQQQKAMETLSSIFRMLNVGPIHDRSNVAPIRRQIDQVYTHLHQLCDVFEGKINCSSQANPHGVRIEESNELIAGLKRLFNESNAAEQVRLMTIAPKSLGRQKIERWCV
ncbi:unnamed protein product [Rotaria sp. Silwood2]|nr:unnamed protein product [Rotaria sp. Silwood2]CAF3316750.1 unnamed protein product [Rotaria sp. Silwood2]CAF3370927.1 unnamed protein product [Rotaria sp. Silwood2]CAF4309239.1 unnamed protein product [Rotaria sp. Silwood2]CAF4434459.1 unnamed protein product [Rotaria sp. Silwood2]